MKPAMENGTKLDLLNVEEEGKMGRIGIKKKKCFAPFLLIYQEMLGVWWLIGTFFTGATKLT